MFRKIRKKKNEINVEEAKNLLHKCRRGVLSMNGEDGYPYAIPINYFYDEKREKIYFHGAKAGYKVDCLKKSDKICFTVYGDEEVKDLDWAPYLKSVVIFGRCHIVEDQEELFRSLKVYALKYYPDEKMVDEEIELAKTAVSMFEIEIEHISGKQIQEK